MASERTEQATPHRRDKARKDGDLLHSRELSSAAATLAGVLVLGTVAARWLAAWRSGFLQFLILAEPARWEPVVMFSTLGRIRALMLNLLLPFGLSISAVAVAALGVGMVQTGGVTVSTHALGMQFDRINPISNLKNLFSLRAGARLGRSLIPASFLAIFAVQKIARQWMIPAFSVGRIEQLGSDVYGLLMAASWLLFAWAAIDYILEWRSREARLRMSKEDLRQEFKETEGNPQIRSRIRGLQRQMRRRKVKADVAKAAVVLTNPTHYAVALGFDFVAMDAPKMLAKGRNLLAEEIKAEARWAGVPIIENPPLARSLYRSVEVGKAIPVDLYAAVAAILAYLYRQRVEQQMRERRMREQGANAETGRQSSPRGDRRFQQGERE